MSCLKIAAVIFWLIIIPSKAWTNTNFGRRLKHTTRNAVSVSSDHHPNNLLSRRQSISTAIGTIGCWTPVFFPTQPSQAYEPDPDKVQESLYLLSRVQEATVQQERLIRKTDLQDVLKRKMKVSLKLVSKSYRMIDQINFLSQYVEPPSEVITAAEAGNEAAEALQTAIDYVNSKDLLDGTTAAAPLTPDQKDLLKECMVSTRENLFTFLQYMPQDKLQNARKRVEEENVKNVQEFGLAEEYTDAAIFNPVPLPWK